MCSVAPGPRHNFSGRRRGAQGQGGSHGASHERTCSEARGLRVIVRCFFYLNARFMPTRDRSRGRSTSHFHRSFFARGLISTRYLRRGLSHPVDHGVNMKSVVEVVILPKVSLVVIDLGAHLLHCKDATNEDYSKGSGSPHASSLLLVYTSAPYL